jgi:tryptophan halogenase
VNGGESMRHVAVAGGGIVAWSAAAALKRHIPLLEVTIVNCPVPPDALGDRMMSTLPSISDFHQDLGLTEADTLIGAQSGLRIGTLFEGWTTGHPSYVHAYASYGAAVEGIPFHQLWLRARMAESTMRFDRFSAAAELGRARRIGMSTTSAPSETIGYGNHLTLERYRTLMRDFALHLGVREQACSGIEPKIRGKDGFVESLSLDTGVSVHADLFVDCTGPVASVRSALDPSFEEWGAWLPCDRVAFFSGEEDVEPAILDRVTAAAAGWQWEASSPFRHSRGGVYSSAHEHENFENGETISIRQGCRPESWLRNCVAIGDSAVLVEPLEWANLHLAHSQIDRLVSMMPGRDCAAVELAEYNRQCSDEARRVRDFICAHYLTARREEPFWKDVAAMDAPPSLAHTLALFAERGRLPYYEEETFSRDSWAAVLLGQGFEPRETDPLADKVPLDRVRSELDRHCDFIRGYVEAQPLYLDYVANLSQPGIQ